MYRVGTKMARLKVVINSTITLIFVKLVSMSMRLSLFWDVTPPNIPEVRRPQLHRGEARNLANMSI
jgi:hypothetical protein